MVLRIEFFGDLACPYSYLAAYRARRVAKERDGDVLIEPRAHPHEYFHKAPHAKEWVDRIAPHVLLDEPDVPYTPWHRSASEWPATLWPAFEAVACAKAQGIEASAELDWRLREAFFGEGRCIAQRDVILEIARRARLDVSRFERDFDSGIAKRAVVEDARMGWQRLALDDDPVFVLPDGERLRNPAGPRVSVDAARNGRVARVDRPGVRGEAALDVYRAMFRRARASSVALSQTGS